MAETIVWIISIREEDAEALKMESEERPGFTVRYFEDCLRAFSLGGARPDFIFIDLAAMSHPGFGCDPSRYEAHVGNMLCNYPSANTVLFSALDRTAKSVVEKLRKELDRPDLGWISHKEFLRNAMGYIRKYSGEKGGE